MGSLAQPQMNWISSKKGLPSRRWEGLLRPDQSLRYEEIANSRLEPGLARWLTTGRVVAGDPKQL